MTTNIVNIARFEEGTEIVVDSEVEVALDGWSLAYCSVVRVGSLVAVHIEVTFTGGAAPQVCQLQPDFAPAEDANLTTANGDFNIVGDGTITYVRSTAGGDGVGICDIVYAAGAVSP